METEEKTTSAQENATEEKQSKKQKPTAFEMAERFKKDVSLINIEGTLYGYYKETDCYTPIEKAALETYLLNKYYDMVEGYGSLQIVKTCAQIIMHTYLEPKMSAERNMLLCYQNGYLDLKQLIYPQFQPYANLPNMVYPTYKILAEIYPGIINWYQLKSTVVPYMDNFLYTIANGNKDIIARIWQMIGYLLTPDRNAKCFFVLQGVPNSGKSVLGNLIKSFFPVNRVASLDIDQLGRRTATSILVNKSINISMDLPNKPFTPLATRNIKQITGNDDITAEYENGKYQRYYGNCKFLFATNHPLTLKGRDTGLEERVVCIPFTRSVDAQFRERNLLNFLQYERNLIVVKALAYYFELWTENYVFAGTENEACKADIRYLPTAAEDTDAHLCEFVDTQCQIVPLDEGATFSCVLYDAYRDYCSQRGYTPVNDQGAFSRRLNKCYSGQVEKARIRQGDVNLNGFRGIVLDTSDK